MESEKTEKREIEEIEGNFMEKDKVIIEFKKFISVLEQNSSASPSSEFIFHRYMGGEINSTDSTITKKGEIFLILKSSITVSKQELTINDINNIFEQKIHSNSFLMPSDSEFTPILNYFFRNRDDFTMDKKEIISFLHEKIKNLQNCIWIENHNTYSFANDTSSQPDCIINFMKKYDNIAFIFQINNLNLIFNESKEIKKQSNKISLLNDQIGQSNQIRKISKNLEDKQISNENTIQKLKNKLNSDRTEFKTKISQLKQDLQHIKSENSELLSENNRLKSKMQDLSKSVQKLELEYQNLIEQKEEIDKDNVLLRENLEENDNKMSDLLEEIKSLKDQNSQLKSSNVQLSDQNKALKVKIRKNTSKIKDILNEIDSFKG